MSLGMHFSDLSLSQLLVDAVRAQGYETPTPIQREAIPHVLAGKDVVALAQTGTGKTAAFALPIIERLHKVKPQGRPIRCLVLSPTRELAAQIDDGFRDYGRGSGLTSDVIFGGVGQDAQEKSLRRGMDVLVATPGRLLDLMGQKLVDFKHLEVLVLDEADRMLDMGFIHDVKRIVQSVPANRQTLLFSATMPADIEELAQRFMKSPVRVAVTPPATVVEKIAQSVFMVEHANKRGLLLHLLKDRNVTRALAFTRTKHGANRVAEALTKAGVESAAIHGNKSQSARERALEGFKAGTVRVLVATDIAARGIDVDLVSHVIQLDLPEVPEQYVHRIGRTARAGAAGTAWAMCASDERQLLRDIERTIRLKIDVVTEQPFHSNAAPTAPAPRGRHSQPANGGHGDREPRGGGRGRGGHGGDRRGGHGGRSSAPARSTSAGASSSAAPSSAAPSRGNTRSFGPGRR